MGAPKWPSIPPNGSARPGGAVASLDHPLTRPAAGWARRGGVRRLVLAGGADAGDLGQSRLFERPVHAVADPLGVPPLERSDGHAGDEHFEVQVVADSEARGARAS